MAADSPLMESFEGTVTQEDGETDRSQEQRWQHASGKHLVSWEKKRREEIEAHDMEVFSVYFT